MSRLTKAQRSVLELCVDDPRGMTGAAAHYAPAKILVAHGLATWLRDDPWSERLIITDAGKALLSIEQGETP